MVTGQEKLLTALSGVNITNLQTSADEAALKAANQLVQEMRAEITTQQGGENRHPFSIRGAVQVWANTNQNKVRKAAGLHQTFRVGLSPKANFFAVFAKQQTMGKRQTGSKTAYIDRRGKARLKKEYKSYMIRFKKRYWKVLPGDPKFVTRANYLLQKFLEVEFSKIKS